MLNNDLEEFKQAAFNPQNDQNLSRLGVNFGSKDYPNENSKSAIQLSFSLTNEESEKQLVFLTKSIKNKLDPNYAIICEFKVLPENQYEFLQTLENIWGPNHQLTELNQALSELILQKQLIIDHFIDKELNKIYLIVKLGANFEEVAIAQMKLFNFLGLEKILKETKNSIEINLSTKNSMKTIAEVIKNQHQNLLSALLEQISLEIIMKSSPTLMQDFLNLIENLGFEGFIQPFNKNLSIGLMNILLRKIKSFDIDLQFNSTNKLDEVFRKRFLNSVLKLEKIKIDKGDEKNYKSLMKCVEGEFTVYFTISEIGSLKIGVKMPEFLELFNFYEIGV